MHYSPMGFLGYLDTMALDAPAVGTRCGELSETAVQCVSLGAVVANAEAPGVPGGHTTQGIAQVADKLHGSFTGFGRQLEKMGQAIGVYVDGVHTADGHAAAALAGANNGANVGGE